MRGRSCGMDDRGNRIRPVRRMPSVTVSVVLRHVIIRVYAGEVEDRYPTLGTSKCGGL